jgi:HD-GYP domain-containing protein (c-di-GMP phosphodiesterase class II)
VVEEESLGAVTSLPARSLPSFEDQEAFPVEGWADGPFLSSEEKEALSIRKGSLTIAERLMIQEHVTETYRFLQKLPWTSDLQRVPEIAWAHHEKLDGSGYPRQLSAPQIPRQSQMMTISDIYDALVAGDRPYKKSVSHDEARRVLTGDARAGRIDSDLLGVFLEAEIFRLPAFTKLLRPR